MEEEIIVTIEELVRLVHSQKKDFIIHIKIEGKDIGEDNRGIST